MKDVVETNADLVKSAVKSAMKDLAETNAEQIEVSNYLVVIAQLPSLNSPS